MARQKKKLSLQRCASVVVSVVVFVVVTLRICCCDFTLLSMFLSLKILQASLYVSLSLSLNFYKCRRICRCKVAHLLLVLSLKYFASVLVKVVVTLRDCRCTCRCNVNLDVETEFTTLLSQMSVLFAFNRHNDQIVSPHFDRERGIWT